MAEEPQNITNESGDGNESVKIEIPKEDYDKLVEEHATSTQSVTNLTSEIKEIRSKKQEAEDALKEALKTPIEPVKPSDEGELTTAKVAEAATKAAQEVVDAAKKDDIERMKEDTILAFKKSKKEFAEDNDPAGIKYSAFEKKLAIFDLSSVTSQEQIEERLNSAFNLLPVQKDETVDNQQTSSSTPSDPGGGGPTPLNPDNLTPKEKKLIERVYGGDSEKYLKQKAKRPDYVEELLRWER